MSASALRNRLTTVLLVASVLALARALWPEGSERTAALYVVVLTLGYGHLFGAALLGRGNRGLRPRGVSASLRFFVWIVAVGTVLAASFAMLELPTASLLFFASPLLVISIWHTVENDAAVVAAYERGFRLGPVARETRLRTLGITGLVAAGAALLAADEATFAEVFAVSTLYHVFQWLVFLFDRIAARGDRATKAAILRGVAWSHLPTALVCAALLLWRSSLPPLAFELVFSPALYLFWSSLHVVHTALARSERGEAVASGSPTESSYPTLSAS